MVSNFVTSCARFIIVLTIVGGSASYADDLHQRLIEAGREQFTRVRKLQTFAVDKDRSEDRFFNATSCAACHRLGGIGGAGGEQENVQLISGNVVHRFGTAPDYEQRRAELLKKRESPNWRVAEVSPPPVKPIEPRHVEREEFTIRCGCSSVVDSGPTLTQLNTPALFGLGLIQSIPQAEIDAIAAIQFKAVRGRSPMLADERLGRFGWKAEVATLADFNERACAAELGLKTARFTPASETTFRRRTPETWNTIWRAAPDVDMTADDLAALTAFTAALPRPVQVAAAGAKSYLATGEKTFVEIGCAACHVRNVGKVTGIYSDLLLHDVGTSAGESFYGGRFNNSAPWGPARPNEFRTPPLWGVADSAPYLHDGSAATLEEAIERHQEQAAPARNRYLYQLTEYDRAQLLAFLQTLRAPGSVAAAKPSFGPFAKR